MIQVILAPQKSNRFQGGSAGESPAVAELLVRQGVSRAMTDIWIRRRLFHPVARSGQFLAAAFGLGYSVPEHELVSDFAQARCTDDVLDGLHQYQKMRGSSGLWSGLFRPKTARVLNLYWGIRRRAESAPSALGSRRSRQPSGR